jgi:hypothetical protein
MPKPGQLRPSKPIKGQLSLPFGESLISARTWGDTDGTEKPGHG